MIELKTCDTPVKFTNPNGEALTVLVTEEGFVVEYDDDMDVTQTWSFKQGFVRRLSLKGKPNASNNVVPLVRK